MAEADLVLSLELSVSSEVELSGLYPFLHLGGMASSSVSRILFFREEWVEADPGGGCYSWWDGAFCIKSVGGSRAGGAAYSSKMRYGTGGTCAESAYGMMFFEYGGALVYGSVISI